MLAMGYGKDLHVLVFKEYCAYHIEHYYTVQHCFINLFAFLLKKVWFCEEFVKHI